MTDPDSRAEEATDPVRAVREATDSPARTTEDLAASLTRMPVLLAEALMHLQRRAAPVTEMRTDVVRVRRRIRETRRTLLTSRKR